VIIAGNVQGFAQVGNKNSCLLEPSAECRIKKLIICSFVDSNRSARTADDSITIADVFSVCPTCAKLIVGCRLHFKSTVRGISFLEKFVIKLKLLINSSAI